MGCCGNQGILLIPIKEPSMELANKNNQNSINFNINNKKGSFYNENKFENKDIEVKLINSIKINENKNSMNENNINNNSINHNNYFNNKIKNLSYNKNNDSENSSVLNDDHSKNNKNLFKDFNDLHYS